MKSYGANKATEFTRKQINVIYRNAKLGNLKVENWMINRLYKLADYYGYDDNGSVAFSEERILRILNLVFENDFAAAQEKLDSFTESEFNTFTEKAQKTFDRTYLA